MAIAVVIFLFTIIGQVISAPSGCQDLCNGSVNNLNTQLSESLAALHTDTFAHQNALRELELQAARVNLDYTRPGNWSEHNDYATDNGAGKVHEEKGQLVNGSAKVRYYKKNYVTSSHQSAAPSINHSELRNIENALLNHGRHSQSAIDANQENYYQQQHSDYNQLNSHRIEAANSDLTRLTSRLEDLSEHAENHRVHGANRVYGAIDSADRSIHNTYGTGGGHGNVYEENGEYNAGPAKVHYYKKNYTSSYSSGSAIPAVRPIEGLLDDSIHLEQNNRRENSYRNVVSGGNYQHYDHNQGSADHRNGHSELLAVDSHYIAPTVHRETSESHHEETRHETYVPTSQSISHTDYRHQSQQQHVNGDLVSGQSQIPRRYVNRDENRVRHHVQNQEIGSGYVVHPGRQVEEQWSSTGHESRYHTIPQRTISNHASEALTQLQQQQLQQQQYGIHSSNSDYNNNNAERQNSNSYHSSGSSSYQQQYETVGSGHFHTGVLDLGHSAADCGGSSAAQYRRYKRELVDENLEQKTEDLTQQTEDLTQQTQSHGSEQYTQRIEDLTQQTQGFDDYYQNHAGNLELNQQHQHQRGSGLEVGQQTLGQEQYTQQTEDLTQQTQGYGDYYQQHSGNLQHSQQHQHQRGSGLEVGQQTLGQEQYTQQTEDLTQQTQGYGDYYQQHSGNLQHGQHTQHQDQGQYTQQTEDLTQQTQGYGDYYQQHSGNLQHGQHTQHQDQGQYTQQTEDLTQQTQGFGDYYQQHSGHSQIDQHIQHQSDGQLTQQTEDLTLQTQASGDYNQQYSGRSDLNLQRRPQGGIRLEVGQQNLGQQHDTQQTEDLTQQTQGYGDYYQQHSGNLQHGQYNQHQDQGQYTQQTEDLTQQAQGYGDYYQQHSGNYQSNQHRQQGGLEFGQGSHQSRDYTQQTEDLTQQSQAGNYQLGQQTYQQNDFGYQRGQDLTQQNSGNLELGQQTQFDNENHQHDYGFEPRPAPKPTPRTQWPQNREIGDTEIVHDRPIGVKGGRPRKPYSQQSNQMERESTGVLSLENQTPEFTNNHHEDVQRQHDQHYTASGIKPNPRVTNEPDADVRDAWGIREINTDDISVKRIPTVDSAPESSINSYTDSTTTPAPGFWKKVGTKIVTTYDKVKTKVTEALG